MANTTAEPVGIEQGQRFYARRHVYNIAVVLYRSASGGVGYRIKGAKREYYSTRENFLRNYTPLPPDPPEVKD